TRVPVSTSPQEGFLHETNLTDTLGFDKPETKCKFPTEGNAKGPVSLSPRPPLQWLCCLPRRLWQRPSSSPTRRTTPSPSLTASPWRSSRPSKSRGGRSESC